jgi:hypothetical protein
MGWDGSARGCPFEFRHYKYKEDEYAYFDSDDDGERSDDGDDEIFGANEPCPDCGRTYPHKHIRALRPGGERAAEEESDENTDSD